MQTLLPARAIGQTRPSLFGIKRLRHTIRFHLLTFLATLTLAGCSLGSTVKPSSESGTATQWMADVVVISSADENTGRRDAIVQRLAALKIPVTQTPFVSGSATASP